MKHLKAGMVFTTIGIYSNFVLQLIINAVLSRLLTPKEYGVVAIMQVFIVFFALMIEAGMGPAIIQNKTLSPKDIKVLFNYSAFFAILLALIFALFGQVLALVYNDSVYKTLTWVQAISVLFNGLNIVPSALLNKGKRFKQVNFSLVIANICAGIVGVTLAFMHFGVYSLIFSAITTSVVNFSLNRYFTKINFSKEMYLEPLKKIWSFSKNQFGFNFINYFSRNSDNILIGKFMGASALANYSKAYQLIMLPNTLFLGIISPVLQPVLSDYQDNVDYIREVYFKIVHILALIGLPLSVFLSLSSKQIIYFMFGTQWSAAIIPFSILSLTVWIQMTLSSSGAILQARNHTKLLFKLGVMGAIILVSSIVIGILLGTINTVATTLAVGFVINYCVNFSQLIKKSLNGSLAEFAKEFISPMLLGIIMFLVIEIYSFVEPQGIFVALVLRGLIFIGVMLLYIIFTKEKELIKMILKSE